MFFGAQAGCQPCCHSCFIHSSERQQLLRTVAASSRADSRDFSVREGGTTAKRPQLLASAMPGWSEWQGGPRLCRAARAAQKGSDAECSDELITAIVHMCKLVGGPASSITREEAIAAATFKDELQTYKCAPRPAPTRRGLPQPVQQPPSAPWTAIACRRPPR